MTTGKETLDFLNISNRHFPDQSAKWLFQEVENLRGLIKIIAPELVELLDFTGLTQLNSSFVSDALRAQESDMVFSVPLQTGNTSQDELLIYILLEHQSTVDPAMGFRLLFYMCQLWDTQQREWEAEEVPKSEWRLRPILPIVFYTGTQEWQRFPSMRSIMEVPEALSRFVPTFDTLLLDVKATEAHELTKTDHPLGWLLRVLQNDRATASTMRDVLLEALSHLDALGVANASQHRRAILYLVLLILHRRPSEEREDLLQLVNEYTPDMEVKSMAQSIIELSEQRGIEQGRAQGIEQGRAQGIEQGARETTVKNIRTVLKRRFPQSDIRSIAQTLEGIGSIEYLEQLLDTALLAPAFNDFLGALEP